MKKYETTRRFLFNLNVVFNGYTIGKNGLDQITEGYLIKSERREGTLTQ